MARVRRPAEEVTALCEAVLADIQGGMMQTEALVKHKVSESVYRRWRNAQPKSKINAPKNALSGTADVSNFPPRPAKKKGPGTGYKAEVDMNSIGSLAKRMLQIERLLSKARGLMAEEKRVKERLKVLLSKP